MGNGHHPVLPDQVRVKVADLICKSTRNSTILSLILSSKTTTMSNSAHSHSRILSLYLSRSLGMLRALASLAVPLTQPVPRLLSTTHLPSAQIATLRAIPLSRSRLLVGYSGLYLVVCPLAVSGARPLERGLPMANGHRRASRLRRSMV